MLFKEKLTSFLFGPKKEDREEESLLTEEEQLPQEDPGTPAAAPEDPSQLEIPADHPIRQLHDLPACIWTRTACFPRSCWRRKKTGCNRP